MNHKIVSGKILNATLQFEIALYFNGDIFEEDKYYIVYEDGNIDNLQGYCLVEGLVSIDVYNSY